MFGNEDTIPSLTDSGAWAAPWQEKTTFNQSINQSQCIKYQSYFKVEQLASIT